MDDDEPGFAPKHYSSSHRRASFGGSSRRTKPPTRNPPYPHRNQFHNDGEDEEIARAVDDDFEVEENGGCSEENDEDYEANGVNGGGAESEDSDRHRKKRRLGCLGGGGGGGFEFSQRVAKAPSSMQNPSGEWTEHATLVLLEAWGDRFLQLGRKSLRSDDWHDVAEKVTEMTKEERTDIQCRNRLDTLKKRYKKEKAKVERFGNNVCNWVYFKKMDMLLASSSRQQHHGLACGVDSGEYVFMNPKVYLSRANGFDEMRDSPDNSENSDGNADGDPGYDSDGLPPRTARSRGDDAADSSIAFLADSIHKFGEIYEKIENSKRQQMMELEKMRMDFHRDLELQKKQILERAHSEIAKLQQEDDEATDVSADSFSE